MFTEARFTLAPPPPGPEPPLPVSGRFESEAYARQLLALLPRGAAWTAEAGGALQRTLLAVADALARVDARGSALLLEADPRTAVETIGAWERVFGLPDECLGSTPDELEDRQASVAQRMIMRGGQSRSYFIGLASSLGFAGATVSELHGDVMRVGFRAGDRCYGGGSSHTWQMNLPASGPLDRRSELECIIRRAAPAHSTVKFSYS